MSLPWFQYFFLVLLWSYPLLVDFLYIQLQLCRRDTLKHELKKRERVDPRKSLKIFEEICLGVQVLHDNEMIHRDLKPANILFSLDKGAIKIGDLGLVVMKGKRREIYDEETTNIIFRPEERKQ